MISFVRFGSLRKRRLTCLIRALIICFWYWPPHFFWWNKWPPHFLGTVFFSLFAQRKLITRKWLARTTARKKQRTASCWHLRCCQESPNKRNGYFHGEKTWHLHLKFPWLDIGIGVNPKNRGETYPPNHPMFNRVFHYKPSILGYPYFWKHPYVLKKDKQYHTTVCHTRFVVFNSSSCPNWGLGCSISSMRTRMVASPSSRCLKRWRQIPLRDDNSRGEDTVFWCWYVSHHVNSRHVYKVWSASCVEATNQKCGQKESGNAQKLTTSGHIEFTTFTKRDLPQEKEEVGSFLLPYLDRTFAWIAKVPETNLYFQGLLSGFPETFVFLRYYANPWKTIFIWKTHWFSGAMLVLRSVDLLGKLEQPWKTLPAVVETNWNLRRLWKGMDPWRKAPFLIRIAGSSHGICSSSHWAWNMARTKNG